MVLPLSLYSMRTGLSISACYLFSLLAYFFGSYCIWGGLEVGAIVTEEEVNMAGRNGMALMCE